jgi:spore coat polysaccharide biosynthesis predicted glycosyltransferase SpsG
MGDVMGSLALADAFSRRGDEALFLVSGGEAVGAIERKLYPLRIVGSVEQEFAALESYRPDAVIVNKLRSAPEYIAALKKHARLTVTIDDAGPAAVVADLAVNPLYDAPGAVTGSEFVSLREEFVAVHASPKEIRASATRVLVMQGGSDTRGFLPRIVRAVAASVARPHVTVVVGPAFRHQRELTDAVKAAGLNIEVLHSPPDIVSVMAQADLAMTAGGLTMFELCAVGTPSIVVCAERFEEETASRMARRGAVVHLGFGDDLDYVRVTSAVDALVEDVAARRRMSDTGKALVDGRGGDRVAQLVVSRIAAAPERVSA